VPPREGCRLPLNFEFLPLPVDPSQMAMTRSLRSTGITPFPHYLKSSNPLSTVHRRFACARLSQPCLPESCPDVSSTFTTIAFDNSSLRGKKYPFPKLRNFILDVTARKPYIFCSWQILHH
jgi:hypothetical protein